LAKKFNCESTHIVGTLRANRCGNPHEVISKKLLNREIFAQQSNSNVVVIKWQDKRDIYLIITKHTDVTFEKRRKNGNRI